MEDDYTDYPDFVTLVEANHGYPATNLQWQPASAGGFPWSGKAPSAELLATTGDALRVWEYFGDAPPASSAYVGRQPGGGGHRLTLKTALSGVGLPPSKFNIPADPSVAIKGTKPEHRRASDELFLEREGT